MNVFIYTPQPDVFSSPPFWLMAWAGGWGRGPASVSWPQVRALRSDPPARSSLETLGTAHASRGRGEALGMRTAVAGKELACPARPTRRAAGLCGFNWVLLPCPSVSLMISVSPEEGNRLVRPPVATNSFLWGSLGKVKE